MSTVNSAIANPDTKNASNEALGQGQPARSVHHKNYRGFVAGIFSGIAKLSGAQPRNCSSIIRRYLAKQILPSWTSVRLLTLFGSPPVLTDADSTLSKSDYRPIRPSKVHLIAFSRHSGKKACPACTKVSCLSRITHLQVLILPGATPPLLGWMFMDSM